MNEIIGISGSERVDGNSDMALNLCSNIVKKRGFVFSTLYLRDYEFKACGSCGDCNSLKESCKIKDDMQLIIKKLMSADAIIYATPVHGFGMSFLMQKFIERAGVGFLRFNRPLVNKVAGVIVTGRRYSFLPVYNQLVQNILLNRMILVGSGYPVILTGGRKGSIAQDYEGVKSLQIMINRVMDMVELLKTYKLITGQIALPFNY